MKITKSSLSYLKKINRILLDISKISFCTCRYDPVTQLCEMSNSTALVDVPAGNLSLEVYVDTTVPTSLTCLGGQDCCQVRSAHALDLLPVA